MIWDLYENYRWELWTFLGIVWDFHMGFTLDLCWIFMGIIRDVWIFTEIYMKILG